MLGLFTFRLNTCVASSEDLLDFVCLLLELFLGIPDSSEMLQLLFALLLFDGSCLNVLGCNHVRVLLLLDDINIFSNLDLFFVHVALLGESQLRQHLLIAELLLQSFNVLRLLRGSSRCHYLLFTLRMLRLLAQIELLYLFSQLCIHLHLSELLCFLLGSDDLCLNLNLPAEVLLLKLAKVAHLL